jgi:hypothetical protein
MFALVCSSALSNRLNLEAVEELETFDGMVLADEVRALKARRKRGLQDLGGGDVGKVAVRVV